MKNKTPEERKAIAEKSHQTRAANKKAKRDEETHAREHALKLKNDIYKLEEKLSELQKMDALSGICGEITGKTLLSKNDISNKASDWTKCSGVYFLLDDDEVVYVGQSVSIFSRISAHIDKKFNRFAYVKCDPASLDKLESLYIHFLQPKLNCTYDNGSIVAPITLDQLIEPFNS